MHPRPPGVTGRRAAELVAAVEERFAMARARYPQFAGASAVPAWYGGDQYDCYGPEEARGRFLTSLGFVAPAGLAELVVPAESLVQVSNEQLSLLDADLMVWFAYDEDNRPTHRERSPLAGASDIDIEDAGIY